MMNQNRVLFCSSTFDGFYELFLAAVLVSLFCFLKYLLKKGVNLLGIEASLLEINQAGVITVFVRPRHTFDKGCNFSTV